jgi:GNAT superfamily N-acetyltransferase
MRVGDEVLSEIDEHAHALHRGAPLAAAAVGWLVSGLSLQPRAACDRVTMENRRPSVHGRRRATGARIRRADPSEFERLREIAIASKSYWGYEFERVRAWAASIDFSPQGLRGKELFVATVNGRLAGWASLIPAGAVAELDDLWIEPEAIGAGIGRRLFRHAAERATEIGCASMEWDAEPNAVGFYEKMGGRYLRESEAGEWGRALPVMGIDLPPAG